MKVITLEAHNFKRLGHVKITPDDAVVQITGSNRAGKTSVLDALFAALDGGASSRLIGEPIREGEKAASVRVELGNREIEYVVTRTWTKNDVGSLAIDSPRGARYGSPQKILDELVGKLSMDPLAFSKQKGSDQVQTLIRALGDTLGFDPVELEARKAEATEERKLANRDVVKYTAQLAGLPEEYPDAPDVEESAVALMDEFGAARSHNELQANLAEDIASFDAEIIGAQQDIKDAEAKLAAIRAERVATVAALADLDGPIDLDAISARIAAIDDTNKKVRANQARATAVEVLALAVAQAAQHDDILKAIGKEKSDGLAAADLPYPGLGFGDDGVTLNNLPFGQASTAEKLTASFAIAVAMNPELRVVRIDQGESLDAESKKQLVKLAEAADTQVWMSVVTEDTTVGIHMVEGEVEG